MAEFQRHTIRIVVAAGNEPDGDGILQILGQEKDLEVVGLAQDGFEAARMAAQLLPDLVLLDEHLPEMDGLAAAVAISLAAPQVATMLLTSGDPAHQWREAIRAGVKDILPKPLQPAALLEAIAVIQRARERRDTREFQALMDPELVPRLIAIAGAKGGVGKTTLAVNLGVFLARQHPGQVALVDLYPQFGDVALMLNLHPDRALADMAAFGDEIDQELLEAHLTPHESGLKVLVGANTPAELNLLDMKALRAVLSNLKRSYRFTVVDVPPMLYDTTTCALMHATAVALVANLFDLTTLNDTRRLYQFLVRDRVRGERVHLVLNRVTRSNRLHIDEIEAALGRTAAATIPNATGLAVSSINAGKPFVATHPEAAVSRSIMSLAETLTRIGPDGAGAREQPPTGRRARVGDAMLSRAT